jgi:hypothetical protein
MYQVAAKKPSEDGIRKEVEKQQKMMELFNELKETVKNPVWDEKPKEFFKALGEKMKKEGIDEMRFCDFVNAELTNSLLHTFRQQLRVRVKAGERGETKKPTVVNISNFAEKEAKLGRELVTVVGCIYEAQGSKQGCAEFFEKITNENDARAKIEEHRKFADNIISGMKSINMHFWALGDKWGIEK